MKAVIASPPVKDFYFTPSRASALGAEAVREILRQQNIETVFFNFPLLKKRSVSLQLPHELNYLDDFLMPEEHGPVSFFTHYRRFGPSMNECSKMIAAESPQVVFITCFAWAYAMETVELAASVKELLPGVPIAVGGAGISVNPSWFKNYAEIDFVITGEAEITLPIFLRNELNIKTITAENDDTPGFYWRETGVSASKNIRYISAILSRGCPKACRFCSNHLVHGRKFRKSSPQDIITGIDRIPRDHNIHFNFEDDNLLLDKKYFLWVINLIKNRFPQASFSAENGLDYTMLDSDFVKILIDSGFRSFNFSMASSSSRLLLQEKREADLNKLKIAVKTAGDAGALPITYFICGLEGDTPLSTIDNLKQLHSIPALTGISMFYPVPGLPGFPPELLSDFSPHLCAGSSAYPWTKSLSTEQLITAFRIARLSNLIKTNESRLPSLTRRLNITHETDLLLKTILKTGRLHTLIKHKVTGVKVQDQDLVSGFLDTLSSSID